MNKPLSISQRWLAAPFPYFGGKRKIAPEVWKRLGNTLNYVEPFFGSGAMLLARPLAHLDTPRTETVNDLNGFIANFWRAVQADPEAVARWADYPVNENDLHARHYWMVMRKDDLRQRIEGDPDYYDAKIAGWWVWGMCAWIGSGFCDGDGSWRAVGGQLIHAGDAGQGIHRKLIYAGGGGRGIHRKLIHAGDAGRGIHRQRIHAGDAGRGIHRQLIHAANAGRGIHRQLIESAIYDWFTALSSRLRRVRVASGDWARVMGDSVTINHGTTAIFLDPPYHHNKRARGLYMHDGESVAEDVRAWCIANGDNPLLRIAYCGYAQEDNAPEKFLPGWTPVQWKAGSGFGAQRKQRNNVNRHREMIWYSPHCLQPERAAQLAMFTDAAFSMQEDAR